MKCHNSGDEEIVFLILGCWGSSVEIMAQIVIEFGGYIDENDCDEDEPYFITKDSDFVYSEYIVLRNKIIGILDENLNQGLKLQVATQIIKHKDLLLETIK